MTIALHYAVRTDVGLVRSRNEDSAYAGPHLLVLADGMGGHAAGNVASSIAVGDLAHLDDDRGGDDALAELSDALRHANESLRDAMRADRGLAGMGTTVTALLRAGANKLALAHIGDSRGYLLRGGELTQITKDHSFVQTLVDEGRITAEDAETHPQRSLVTRVLTGHAGDEPDLSMREARVGDRFLLCSDGLSDVVGFDNIRDALAEAPVPAAAAERLVELALKAGAPDNVTCVVADVVDPGSEASTTPEVVGAAAERKTAGVRTATAPLPQLSPAEKAASLRREVTGEPDPAEDLRLAEEVAPSRRGRRARRTALVLLVLLVLGVGGYAAYAWSQQQYYVGAEDGKVVIFRGIPQTLGPLRLASLAEASDVALADLPDFYRNRVEDAVTVADLGAAHSLVTDLRVQALTCQDQRAAGQACGGSG